MNRTFIALTASFALALTASPASAIEIYASSPGTVVVPSPLVYAPPPRPIVVVRTAPPPVVVHSIPAPVTVTHVNVAQPETPSDQPTHPQPEERRDPRASFFVGGGYGGMTAFQGGAAGTWRMHVGLGLGATELGLRAHIANRALGELSTSPGSAWVLSAEVAHRFLPGATVRPVIGASFDRWQFDPDGRESASAFGVSARGGVEIHYHLNPGAALVFGADVGYHRLLTSVDDVAVIPNAMTFGATVDIRL
jgi:hypothetical protein